MSLAQPLFAQNAPKRAEGSPAAGKNIQLPPMPDDAALNILIRRTLLTLNDANLTGNYSVLRDLAAPDFQQANDPAKLAGIFAHFRKNKIDMAPIVYFDPKLVRKPALTKNGMLRLSGFIPTQPQQINFDMLFQKVQGRWRLYGIAANTAIANAAAAAQKSGSAANTKNTKSN
jgi:hypothetical protein